MSICTFVHAALLFFAARKHHSVYLLSAVTFRFSLQHYYLLYYFYETVSGWVGFFPPICFPSSVLVVFLDSGSHLFIFFIIRFQKNECEVTYWKE